MLVSGPLASLCVQAFANAEDFQGINVTGF